MLFLGRPDRRPSLIVLPAGDEDEDEGMTDYF